MKRRGPTEFDAHGDTAGRGREAEAAGVGWLERQGYTILERNVRTPAGEIDVVAVDRRGSHGPTLCFVEVKARLDTRYGRAVAAVGRAKQRRLARAARWYLAGQAWDGPCRFDVLGLEPEQGRWRYDLVRDAFEAWG